MYDTEISATTLSSITDRIIPQIKEWQQRPLYEVYCIVWMDAMHYKVRDNGKVENRAVYNILGITTEGKKELLGMYVSQNEGANFWLSVLGANQQHFLNLLANRKARNLSFIRNQNNFVNLSVYRQVRNYSLICNLLL